MSTLAEPTIGGVVKPKKRSEFLYFALRNNKLRVGLVVLTIFIVLALIGPLLTDYDPEAFVGPPSAPPSSEYWFGTTTFGQDVFSQFVLGLQSTFLVGIVGGGLGTLLGVVIGFTAGFVLSPDRDFDRTRMLVFRTEIDDLQVAVARNPEDQSVGNRQTVPSTAVGWIPAQENGRLRIREIVHGKTPVRPRAVSETIFNNNHSITDAECSIDIDGLCRIGNVIYGERITVLTHVHASIHAISRYFNARSAIERPPICGNQCGLHGVRNVDNVEPVAGHVDKWLDDCDAGNLARRARIRKFDGAQFYGIRSIRDIDDA